MIDNKKREKNHREKNPTFEKGSKKKMGWKEFSFVYVSSSFFLKF